MTLEKIKYECKSCGWYTRVPEQWGDLKPSYCGNAKCAYSKGKSAKTKKSFRLDPDNLKIVKPKKPEAATKTEKNTKPKKTKDSVKYVNRSEATEKTS